MTDAGLLSAQTDRKDSQLPQENTEKLNKKKKTSKISFCDLFNMSLRISR